MFHYRLSCLVLTCLTLVSCGLGNDHARLDSPSKLATDLGPIGNQEVATMYQRYIARSQGCHGSTNWPRIVVSGFGLFSGVSHNISGLVVQTMAAPYILDSYYSSRLETDTPSLGRHLLRMTHADPEDFGGQARVRIINIDGAYFEVCFLTLDVMWDLASAIILYEAERFQASAILMTGRGEGSVIIESGAINRVSHLTGYDFAGERAPENLPHSTTILSRQDFGVVENISMNWPKQLVYERSKPLIEAMGYHVSMAGAARPSNRYICNNVSFVVLHGIKNIPINLAGGLLQIRPNFSVTPVAGFMHLPANARPSLDDVAGWARVLATSFAAMASN